MTKITEAATLDSLPTAAWDLESFLNNARTYTENIGGLILMLLGAVALIWGGVQLVKKLMGNPQTSQQINWGTVALLIIVGGALFTGGFSLMKTVGSGGEETINDLGGGTVVLGSID
jgi:uncharacterized membrane protein